jgi:hypothetical protein
MYPADVWVLVTRAYLLGLDEGIRWSEDLLRRAQAKGDTENRAGGSEEPGNV